MEESSQQSLYTLAIFVYEGSSLPTAVWRCRDENPTWLMPVKDSVTFTPLKQRRPKAAKSVHRGVRSFVLLKPLFCSTETFLLFCAPSDHRTAQVGRDLERSSGPPFHRKGSLGGIVKHLVRWHPTTLQQWGLYSVPGEVVPLGWEWHVMMLAWKLWRC